jgi:hypothetical protein
MRQFLYLLTVPFLFNMPDGAVPVFVDSAFLFNMPDGTVPVFVDSAFFIQYAR